MGLQKTRRLIFKRTIQENVHQTRKGIMKKIIEQTERYDIIQMNFRSLPITFRCWKDGSKIIEIRVDANFAKANDYKSVEDMAEKTIGQAKFNEIFGGVPDWIRVGPNGEFTFVGISPILFN